MTGKTHFRFCRNFFRLQWNEISSLSVKKKSVYPPVMAYGAFLGRIGIPRDLNCCKGHALMKRKDLIEQNEK
jgi:hypothetical protein